MTFEELLDQAIALLQRRGRLTYRALKRQFDLDDDYLEDLKAELIQGQRLAVDEEGTVLVWCGDAVPPPVPPGPSAQAIERAPLTYTPPYLAEKILTSRSALEGERKQVTVLFADIKDSTELIKDLDPEAAQQLLDPAIHIMMEAIHRFEGTVNQVLGDGIMSIFGAPIAHEDPRPQGLLCCLGDASGDARLYRGSEPVEVFELTGASSIRRRLQAAVARGLTKFVGRDTEIEAINQALEQAGTGHGQIVAAVGEPGVGKSRLVYEFMHSHRTKGWLVLESTSVSYGKATPYFPIIDLLKRYVHVEEGDESRTIRAKVTGQILTLDESLQETIPALLLLLDALPENSPFLQLDPPQRRQRTLDGFKRILLRESQGQPLLLVFEDLHWIDAETQALLDSLIESLPAAQLLLLVNYRPEYQHGWGSKTYYTQVRLDPLLPENADVFLEALLGNDSSLDPLKKLLIERTGGNPFFLEESVRTLVETQTLVGEPGAYRRAHDLLTIQVPPTVQAVLAARIDRLPQEEKRLLQTAAVIGTEVPLPLLEAIDELPKAARHRDLGHLQAAEFLYETSLFPDRVYTFKHALTHEVAYGSLLLERRRVLHGRIVEALEALAPDRVVEQVERLAHHAVRGEVWDKALAYCRQAGEKTMARSAHREAVGYFEQALGALPHLPEQRHILEQAIDLRIALRSALWPSGDMEHSLACLREAEALAEALDDPRRLAQVSLFLTENFRMMGAYDQAIAAVQPAFALATASGDVGLHVLTNQRLGQAYLSQGDYRRAINCLELTVASLDGAARRERFGALFLPAVLSRTWLAWCHAELGTFAEGRTLGEEGLRIAEEVNHPGSLMYAYHGIGLLALRQGDLTRALPRLERAMGLCQDADIPLLFPWIAADLGAAYALAGRGADAVPLLMQAMERSTATKTVVYQALCGLSLGEAQVLAGSLVEAHALTEGVLASARERQERGYQASALRLLGEIAAHRDPPQVEQAGTHYQQALTLAEELGMRPLQAHCHRGLGILYLDDGRLEQARTELSESIEMYRAMDMTFWLPQTEAALAQVEER